MLQSQSYFSSADTPSSALQASTHSSIRIGRSVRIQFWSAKPHLLVSMIQGHPLWKTYINARAKNLRESITHSLWVATIRGNRMWQQHEASLLLFLIFVVVTLPFYLCPITANRILQLFYNFMMERNLRIHWVPSGLIWHPVYNICKVFASDNQILLRKNHCYLLIPLIL